VQLEHVHVVVSYSTVAINDMKICFTYVTFLLYDIKKTMSICLSSIEKRRAVTQKTLCH
jgi:hypothetical protein